MSNETRLQIERIPVTALHQNCSLVWNPLSKRGLVVDPGGDVDLILERIAAHDLTIDAILLTHGHLDHVGGADELRERLARLQPDSSPPVVGPSKEDDFLLAVVEKNAANFGVLGMRNVTPDRFVAHGETLDLLGHAYEILHVPGHTPGHVVFFDRKDRVLFAGDTLFRGTIGRTDFPYGDGQQLIDHIKTRLLPLGDDVIVLPGHGAPTTLASERQENPFLS